MNTTGLQKCSFANPFPQTSASIEGQVNMTLFFFVIAGKQLDKVKAKKTIPYRMKGGEREVPVSLNLLMYLPLSFNEIPRSPQRHSLQRAERQTLISISLMYT